MLQNRGALPKILFAITGCELAGALGTLWMLPGVRDWFPTLIKPPWTPPAGLFGPIWIVLYAMTGVALGLIWSRGLGTSREKRAVAWFAGQLALTVVWSWVFFGLRSPGGAYGVVILLWLSVAATLWLFSKISRTAGWLLVPYLLWVTFASSLNFAILSLNFLKPAIEQMDADPRNGPKNSKPGASLRPGG